MKEKFDDMDQKVATKSCIDKLFNIIDEQEQTISEMEWMIKFPYSKATSLI